jgi:hypothetical protein
MQPPLPKGLPRPPVSPDQRASPRSHELAPVTGFRPRSRQHRSASPGARHLTAVQTSRSGSRVASPTPSSAAISLIVISPFSRVASADRAVEAMLASVREPCTRVPARQRIPSSPVRLLARTVWRANAASGRLPSRGIRTLSRLGLPRNTVLPLRDCDLAGGNYFSGLNCARSLSRRSAGFASLSHRRPNANPAAGDASCTSSAC